MSNAFKARMAAAALTMSIFTLAGTQDVCAAWTTIGDEFRPTIAERAAENGCTDASGVTTSLREKCDERDEVGRCTTLSTLLVEWHDEAGTLVAGPVVANEEPAYLLASACGSGGSMIVAYSGVVRVVDRDGPRGAPSPLCTTPYCYIQNAAAAAAGDGFVVAYSSGYGYAEAVRINGLGVPDAERFVFDDGEYNTEVFKLVAGADAAGNVLIALRTHSWTYQRRGVKAALLRTDSTLETPIYLSDRTEGTFDLQAVRSDAPQRFMVAWYNPTQAGWVARSVSGEEHVPTTTTTTTTLEPDFPVFLPARDLASWYAHDWHAPWSQPALAGSEAGRWLSTFPDTVDGDPAWTYGVSTDGGSSWEHGGVVDAAADPAHTTAVAIGGGAMAMVWTRSFQDAAIWMRRSTDGEQWSAPQKINAPAQFTEQGPQIDGVRLAAAGDGRMLAVWVQSEREYREDYTWRVRFCGLRSSMSADGGATWSDARTVAHAECLTVQDFEVATDERGRWLIVWNDGHIKGTRSADNGATWSVPKRLVSVQGASWLDVAADGSGGWMLAFVAPIAEADGGQRTRVFLATSRDNAATWSEPAGLAPWHGQEGGADSYPSLASAGRDRWGIAWSTFEPSKALDGDIVAAFSSDGGATWTLPHAVHADASLDTMTDTVPELVHIGDQAWGVLWRSYEDGWENEWRTVIRFSRTLADCGNGRLDRHELCDDGNAIDGDGCDHNCTPSQCGNLIVSDGEECDDADADESDECVSTCRIAVCGDGFVKHEEACDDGNDLQTDACLNDCTGAWCGDGHTRAGFEECDDAVSNDINAACQDDCTLNVCGDGDLYWEHEQCDDGNRDNGDRCTKRCRVDPVCDFEVGSGQGATASDALQVLRKAVGFKIRCPLRLCDGDGNGRISAADALRKLQTAVGLFAGDGCGKKRTLVVRLLSSELLGALQVRVDYSASSGDIPMDGYTPRCEEVAPSDFSAVNLDGGRGVFYAGFVSLNGFQGPTDLVRCQFRSASDPTPGQLTIVVDDASNPDFEEQTPRVEVVVE